MGACDFEVFVPRSSDPGTPGARTADEAFALARKEAFYEHGHGGRTGTIAEKQDYVLRSFSPMIELAANDFIRGRYRPGPRGEWQLVSLGDSRLSDRWEPAFCVPIAREEILKTQERRYTLSQVVRQATRLWQYRKRDGSWGIRPVRQYDWRTREPLLNLWPVQEALGLTEPADRNCPILGFDRIYDAAVRRAEKRIEPLPNCTIRWTCQVLEGNEPEIGERQRMVVRVRAEHLHPTEEVVGWIFYGQAAS